VWRSATESVLLSGRASEWGMEVGKVWAKALGLES
jgi:hypothetical protein